MCRSKIVLLSAKFDSSYRFWLTPISGGLLSQKDKGGVYEVVCTALDEKDSARVVVYKDPVTGVNWVRPLNSFLAVLGKTTQYYRFSKIKD